jgi:carboxyl-terminal processing protease
MFVLSLEAFMPRSLSFAGFALGLSCVLSNSAAIGDMKNAEPHSLLAHFSALAAPVPIRPLPLTATALFSGELSAKDRMANFEKIWHGIQDNYYDPGLNGVDWDEVHRRYRPQVEGVATDQEFYKLMERMAGELHDAHTHVLSPAVAENFKKQNLMTLGFRVDEFEGKLIVISVEAGSSAEQAGIIPGMSIVTIDGKPLAERLADETSKLTDSSSVRATRLRLYGAALGGPPGSTLKLGLQRADGSPLEVTVKRDFNGLGARLSAKTLPSGNAYISFNAFYPPAASQFRDAMQKFHDAPGLIIDLRRNPGGSGDELMAIAANFFSTKTVFARNKLRTRDTRPNYVESNGGPVYSGPVVILVNQHSGSSSELFAGGMQDSGRAKVVGSQTCGCVLGVNHPLELKGGGLVMISKVLWFTPSGRKLEGEGVIPDKIVASTLPDIIEQRDPVLAAGEQLLKEMLSTKQAKQ